MGFLLSSFHSFRPIMFLFWTGCYKTNIDFFLTDICYIKISALIFLCAQGSHYLEAIPAVTLPCLAQGPMWY